MDKVKTIKNCLQNQKKEWMLCQSSEAKYRMEAYTELLDFINSIQEEPVSEDLEEAAKVMEMRKRNMQDVVRNFSLVSLSRLSRMVLNGRKSNLKRIDLQPVMHKPKKKQIGNITLWRR